MSIVYCRDDTVNGHWTGVNRLLTEYEIDNNFYTLNAAIVSVSASITANVGVSSITSDGSALTFHMSDTSTQGPFPMPVPVFVDRGTWTPSTPYLVNDTFSYNGTLYRVTFAHTSASTFSPTANDGAGHDYYAAMVSMPGNALPAGGAAGMMLKKSTGSDYAVTWAYPLPTGGTQYQVLMKNSSTTQDASWTTLGASHVSYTPSTASGLTSTNVASALEEIETKVLGRTLAGLSDVHFGTGDPLAGDIILYTGTNWVSVPNTDTIEFVIDGGGSAITTGLKGYLEVPYNCTITAAKLLADQSGSIVVNVWKSTYANFQPGTHPVSGDAITSSTPPYIISSYTSSDSSLTGWITSIAAGDILAFNVDSVSTITRVTLSLTVMRTA